MVLNHAKHHILTNNAIAFQNTTTVLTGLSDFHKLVLTILKTRIAKSKSQKDTDRGYIIFFFLLDLMRSYIKINQNKENEICSSMKYVSTVVKICSRKFK